MMKVDTGILRFLLIGVLIPVSICGGQVVGQSFPERAIAVTFDDIPGLPVLGDCDREGILALNERLVDAAVKAGIPAMGLVTESRVCADLREEVLSRVFTLWLDAGFELGNHTFSHPDLNRTSVEDFKADIVRGEDVLAPLLDRRGERIRYFRYPMLHTGNTPDKKEEIAEFLEDRGYTNAPVTIDNQEWVFAGAYRRALAAGNSVVADCVADAYVPFMERVTAFFENWSVEVLGYEPSQVLLLHDNELNSDRLRELVGMLKRRGYRFVTLDEALADSAYAQTDEYVGSQGLSWLHRRAVGRGLDVQIEPREPDWVATLNRPWDAEKMESWSCPSK